MYHSTAANACEAVPARYKTAGVLISLTHPRYPKSLLCCSFLSQCLLEAIEEEMGERILLFFAWLACASPDPLLIGR